MREKIFGTLIPIDAFNPTGVTTRDLSISGTGSSLLGKRVYQLSGILGWSSVLNSGAQL